MSDFDINKLNPTSRVNKVQEKKKFPEEEKKEAKQRQESSEKLFAASLLLLKKTINSSFLRKKKSSQASNLPSFREELLVFQKLLQILTKNDQSFNPEFTIELVSSWKRIVNNEKMINYIKDNNKNMYNEIRKIINQISSYPPQVEYSLGFYLSSTINSSWLPHPLILMLNELHKESVAKKEQSHLFQWIALLQSAVEETGKERFPL